MGEEKIDEPKREKRLPSQKLSSICTEQKKGLLGTWKSIAHHPLHKLSTQGWIIKQTGFPRPELVYHFILQTLISWSQVLSNKSRPKSKIIWRLNPVALSVQCKTLQFCKAGNIVSKFNFLLLTFYTRSLSCLIFYYDWWNQKQETEILPLQNKDKCK